MDGLRWDASQLVSDIPILRSTHEQHQDLEGGGYSITNLSSSVFNQMQEMQKSQTTCGASSSEMIMSMMMPNTNLPSLRTATTMPVKAAAVTSLELEAYTSQSCHQSLSASMMNNYVPDFSMAHQQQQLLINNGTLQITKVNNNTLDHCMLSTVDGIVSTENKSGEDIDDGISMILSDCRNLWNNSNNFSNGNSAAVVSSGESESDASNSRDKNMQQYHHVNELEETVVSQSSSDQYVSRPKFIDSCEVNNCTKWSNNDTHYDPYFSIVQNYPAYNTEVGTLKLISENQPKSKKPRWDINKHPCSSTICFQQPNSSSMSSFSEDSETIAQMKEMIYRAAAFRPVNLGLEVVEKPQRKNVKISSDPQTVAARQRRERISERIRVLQKIVPGGSNMDTASMLDEAANYLKFLRSQVKALESVGNKVNAMNNSHPTTISFSFNPSFPMQTHFPIQNPSHSIQPFLG
ncbi:hypothetical protein Lal_00009894 [Lupinus albus]|uniref:Putative transcription factor bHLH family n=1 Tax=Lupinus albus TaxID=3870 RepID=A0A6A4NF24_LUPAL|nr:putative transcription factor bHLH family [Lupinus albus]KAF1859310.1 hypothetical protein Lal_00009894 [Lupinus albus]